MSNAPDTGPEKRAKVTAAPGFFTLGGRDLIVTPLTDQDWGELFNYFFDTPLREANKLLGQLPQGTAKSVIDRILDRADEKKAEIMKETADPEFLRRTMASLDSLAFVLWMSLRKRQNDITLTWCRDVIFKDQGQTAAVVGKVIEGLNTLSPELEKKS